MNWLKKLIYKDWLALPLKGYPRWDAKKYMLKYGAKMDKCGWCGQEIPLYQRGGGVDVHEDGVHADIHPFNGTCIACGRDPYEFFGDWIYRAEYSDGCVVIKTTRGMSSYGPEHAPHLSFFPDDVPVREWRRAESLTLLAPDKGQAR